MGETIQGAEGCAAKPEQVPDAAKYTEQFAANKIGMKLDFFDPRDLKTVTEWMAKNKKPTEFALGFDGDNVKMFCSASARRKNPTAKVSLFRHGQRCGESRRQDSRRPRRRRSRERRPGCGIQKKAREVIWSRFFSWPFCGYFPSRSRAWIRTRETAGGRLSLFSER